MRAAVIVGYHGRKNLGDDIFLVLGVRWLERYFGITQAHIAGYCDSVPATIDGSKVTLVAFEERNALFRRTVWIQTFLRALRSDVILFCAGSIFTIQPFTLAFSLLKILKIIRPETKIYGIGVSIGPFRTASDRYWCSQLLKNFDGLILRDTKSLTELRQEGWDKYIVGYDLALTWHEARKVNMPSSYFRVGLCINGSGSIAVDSILSALEVFQANKPPLVIDVLSVCTDSNDGDVVFSEAIIGRLRSNFSVEHSIYYGYHPDEYLKRIRGCSCLISNRMHTAVLAMMQGIPTFALSYAPKILDFYDHCSINHAHIAQASLVTQNEIVSFLQASWNGELADMYAEVRGRLLECGDKMITSMGELAQI